jgi:hypothetical protein
LANVFCNLIEANGPESGNIEEAEMLARTALRIMKELKRPTFEFKKCFDGLLGILFFKKDYGVVTESLLNNYLSNAIRCQGLDGKSTCGANDCLGRFHFRIYGTLPCYDAKDVKLKHL